MAEIDPCAFCGEYDGECAISGVPNHQGKRKFAVYCNGCFCEGPPAETKDEAIEAWNRRATPAPAQPDPLHVANERGEGWQPIETAPREFHLVLALTRGKQIRLEAGRYLHRVMGAAKIDGDECYYTHWAAVPDLPAAPKEKP